MRKKGFTLIELIIVIAIIGILAGVLIPSWGYYMQRARTRSQNLKCKTIFNTAQTIVTDMKFYENKKLSLNMPANLAIYGFDGTDSCEYVYFWNGSQGALLKSDGSMNFGSIGESHIKDGNAKISNAINKILGDNEVVYKIYVKDYKVMSVVSARSTNDRYLGSYPLTLDKLEENGKNADTIREGKIENVDMTWFDLDPGNDGALAEDDD